MRFQAFILVWLHLTATFGEEFTQTDQTVLILYRRKDYFGSDFTVKINNQLITEKFSNNEYLRLDVPAGKIKIETEGGFITEKQSMTFLVKANEVVYLKGIVDYDYLSNALYFKRIPADTATQEITKTKLDETALRKIE
jgi:hypothetical protein